jgi:DNA-binding response OmpR family regulator
MTNNLPTVLFAGRDLEWSRPVRARLRERGVRVMTADSVEEALEAVRYYTPELVVLDSALAGVSSSDTVATIRVRSPQSGVILMTDHESPEIEASVRKLGLTWYGVKSLDPVALLEVILFALGGRPPVAEAGRRRPPLVLCVDDDARYLGALTRALASHGYRVCSCDTAERALKLVPEVKPDLAILDIMMPGMDGLDLAQEIRNRFGARVPVVLLTALGADEAQYEGHQRGAKYFITKPCEPQKVFDVVDYFVGDLDEQKREELKARL